MRAADSILADALDLPEDERARLALRLAESLHGDPQPEAERAWVKEIARRVERVRDGTAETVTGEEALASARARLSSRRA